MLAGRPLYGAGFAVDRKGLYAAVPDIFADAARLPLLKASVDAVCCLEVLEHVRDPNAALAEFSRVLTPGGTILFSMSFKYPTHYAPHDFQRLTEYGLRRDFDAAGFDIVELRKSGHALHAAALLLCLALVGGVYERRNWIDYLRMPLIAVGVVLVNLSAAVAAWLIPDWSALGTGYEVELRRR